jgi:mannosyl-3-phosphoglycerate phosphatase
MREYDEPFRFVDDSIAAQSRLLAALHDTGLRCTRGGRYFHVTGISDKGLAVRKLRSLFTQTLGRVITVGLGDSLNDLPLLREVDLPIIVRNPATNDSARLLRKVPTAKITRKPGPAGWNDAILEAVEQVLTR